MSLTSRIRIAALALLAAILVTFGAAWVGYTTALADAGSAALPAAGSAAAPAVSAPMPDVDPGQVVKLWESGAFLAAGTLTLFLLLTLALKLDEKRAFYYTAGLAGVAGLVDMVAAGHKLTWSAVVVALTTIASIVVKGPQLRKT